MSIVEKLLVLFLLVAVLIGLGALVSDSQAHAEPLCEGYEDASWCQGPSEQYDDDPVECERTARGYCQEDADLHAAELCEFDFDYCFRVYPDDDQRVEQSGDEETVVVDSAAAVVRTLPRTGLGVPALVLLAAVLLWSGAALLLWPHSPIQASEERVTRR